MATHSSVLAWRIPEMGEPGELPSMGSHRVNHNWSDLAAAALSAASCDTEISSLKFNKKKKITSIRSIKSPFYYSYRKKKYKIVVMWRDIYVIWREIKRHLLPGRKVMINLDNMLKSRDITLPTKVHLVKAMVFPVVMYGCESWTIKKAESIRIDAFELCWRCFWTVLEMLLNCVGVGEDSWESLGLQGDPTSPS